MIKILVDSASDLTKDSKAYDMFIPLTVSIGGKDYRDGENLDKDTFYSILTGSDEFPKTSQPSPDAFMKLFEQVKKERDELIYFSISSALSGTYQSATIAKEMVDYDKIYIVDSLTATHMIAILAEYARELIDNGLAATEIVEKCEELKGRIKVVAAVDTLEYLYKGGRLSKTTATVGSIAGIKPVVTITNDGKVDSIGKCLGKGKAMQFIKKYLEGFELDDSFPLYSVFSYGDENCIKVEEDLSASGFKIKSRLQIGSTIGAHVGPGAYGIIFVTK